MENLIQAVKDYALSHYEKGWDVVIETMSDDEIQETIGAARTVNGALRKMYQAINPYNEARHEAVNA